MADPKDVVERATEALEGTTEGPWIVSARWSYYNHMLFVEREGTEICHIASREDGDNDAPESPVMDEALANARFIAASPDLVRELVAEVRGLRKRNGELEAHRKEAGDALLQFTPGGSEYFVQDGDGFRVDPQACASVIREKMDSRHDALCELATLRKRLSHPTDEDVEAAARAIYAIRPFVVASTSTTMGAQIGRTFDWDAAPHYYQQDMLDIARAALEARGR